MTSPSSSGPERNIFRQGFDGTHDALSIGVHGLGAQFAERTGYSASQDIERREYSIAFSEALGRVATAAIAQEADWPNMPQEIRPTSALASLSNSIAQARRYDTETRMVPLGMGEIELAANKTNGPHKFTAEDYKVDRADIFEEAPRPTSRKERRQEDKLAKRIVKLQDLRKQQTVENSIFGHTYAENVFNPFKENTWGNRLAARRSNNRAHRSGHISAFEKHQYKNARKSGAAIVDGRLTFDPVTGVVEPHPTIAIVKPHTMHKRAHGKFFGKVGGIHNLEHKIKHSVKKQVKRSQKDLERSQLQLALSTETAQKQRDKQEEARLRKANR